MVVVLNLIYIPFITTLNTHTRPLLAAFTFQHIRSNMSTLVRLEQVCVLSGEHGMSFTDKLL